MEPPCFSKIQSIQVNYLFKSSIVFESILLELTPLLSRAEERTVLDEMMTSGKVYVLLFGLSIHSFFEGLGISFK